jgi:cell division protein FtsB
MAEEMKELKARVEKLEKEVGGLRKQLDFIYSLDVIQNYSQYKRSS